MGESCNEEAGWARIDAKLNKLPLEFVEYALWHIDNAGAVLISLQRTNPLPAKAGGSMAQDTSDVVIPVPPEHKVVLQR